MVPLQRWDVDEYFSPEAKSRRLSMYVRMAAFVDDLDRFDASLFRCRSARLIAQSCHWTTLHSARLDRAATMFAINKQGATRMD